MYLETKNVDSMWYVAVYFIFSCLHSQFSNNNDNFPLVTIAGPLISLNIKFVRKGYNHATLNTKCNVYLIKQ